jgi:benzoyl-CoA reductase/2-hydroxyglutaryl-CoA dehydratase subunit BcrC/BadD/HgdB
MALDAFDMLQILFNNYPDYIAKQIAAGKKVIATICPYVPAEIIEAAGAVYVPLTLSHAIGKPEFVQEGENYLYPDICPLPKAFYGALLTGACPRPDLITVSCTCDHRVKTAEVLHYQGHDVYFLGIPPTESSNSLEYLYHEFRNFRSRVEEITGKEITDSEIKERLKLRNEVRAVFQDVLEELKTKRYSMTKLFKFMIGNINFMPEDYLPCLQGLLEELRNQEAVPGDKRPRIMSMGSMPFDPIGYYTFLSEQCDLVMADFFRVSTLTMPISTEGDLIHNIAAVNFETQCECHAPNEKRVETIVRKAGEYAVDAVIYHIFTPCQTFALGRYKLLQRLDALKIPHLTLQTDYLMQNRGQMETRIQAFLEMLESKQGKHQ